MFPQSGTRGISAARLFMGLRGTRKKNWYSETHFLPLLEMPELVEKPRLNNLFLAVCMTVLSQMKLL